MDDALDSSVFEKVLLAVEQTTYVGDYGIRLTTRLAEDLELGKFGMLKLALYLEEIFDFELPDEALKRFFTVEDIVKYVSRRYFRDFDFSELAMAA
jgi:acyl carrier protein